MENLDWSPQKHLVSVLNPVSHTHLLCFQSLLLSRKQPLVEDPNLWNTEQLNLKGLNGLAKARLREERTVGRSAL